MNMEKELDSKHRVLINRITELEKKLAIANSKTNTKSLNEIELLVAFSEASFEAVFLSQKGLGIGQNITAEKMFGYTFKESIGKPVTNWVVPEEREIVKQNMLSECDKPYKTKALRKDGTTFSAEIKGKLITYKNSKVCVTVFSDITQREKEEKLQKVVYSISERARNSKTLDELYKNIHFIVSELMVAKNFYIAIYDEKNDIITFPYSVDRNRKVRKPRISNDGLTEYVLSKKKSVIITEEIIKKLQKKGKTNKEQSHLQVWVGIYLKLECNHKGVLVVQDYENKTTYGKKEVEVLDSISAQIVKVINKKFAEAKLQKSLEELSEAKRELELINKNKDRFFSIIAHDLRSPFMALMGISQMISEDLDSMSIAEVKEMTISIHNSTQNLYKLIENLLSWSRLQMGTYQVIPNNFNIKEAYLNVHLLLQLLATEKNITIKNNIPDVFVYADENCVKTILRNLVNNAIKFTERGGEINLWARKKRKYVEITVKDNGVGISKTVLKKLFSIIEVVSEVGTEKETGTGLGLILCKELVEKNGGKIRAESDLGWGSIFTFTLPVAKLTK